MLRFEKVRLVGQSCNNRILFFQICYSVDGQLMEVGLNAHYDGSYLSLYEDLLREYVRIGKISKEKYERHLSCALRTVDKQCKEQNYPGLKLYRSSPGECTA